MTEVESRTRRSGTPAAASRPSRSSLIALRIGELRDLAASLGIGLTSTMRKGTLVDAINEQYDNTDTTDTDVKQIDQVEQTDQVEQAEAPAGQDAEHQEPSAEAPAEPAAEPDVVTPAEVPTGSAVTSLRDASEPADVGPAVAEAEGGAEAPTEPVSVEQPVADDAPAADETPDAVEATAEPVVETETVRVDEAEGGAAHEIEDSSDARAQSTGTSQPKSAASHVNSGLTGIAEDLQALQRAEVAERADGEESEEAPADGERQTGRRGRGRGRGRGQAAQGAPAQAAQAEGQPKADAQPARAEAPAKQEQASQPVQNGAQQQNGAEKNGAEKNGSGRNGQQNQQNQQNQQTQQPAQDNQQDGEGRRGRYRDRKRRGQGTDWDEPEIRDDDVLIPIAGILDVLDNYAFVRTSGYLSGTNDVYVSLGQVKKYHLRRGDAVVGSIRQVPDNDQPSRQKYNALVKVDSINGLPVAEAEGRVEFEKLTPLYPAERLRLETEPQKLSARIVDLVAPLGKGQRGLIVAPPKAGTTLLLQAIANAITKNNPEVHLMVVLVDERPEDVTEMQRTVKGEVIAATFDRPSEDATTVADLAVERAKRLVELGYDVVLLLDSITRLGRAYNQTVPQTGRLLAGGIDMAALLPAKQFFGAARNIENGGSLTILAAALVETGSPADDAILAEFTGAANFELTLSSALADKRIFPSIDITHSGTRREEMLMGPDEVKVTWQLRRAIAGHTAQEALDVIIGKLRDTQSNVEFLVQMQKSLPSGK